MTCLTQSRGVSHAIGLVFSWNKTDLLLCFVLSRVALETGAKNYTLPGGKIRQCGCWRFESAPDAFLREVREETGTPRTAFALMSQIGSPITHTTGLGVVKKFQPFVGVVTQPCFEPCQPEEIAAVAWSPAREWGDFIGSMNPRKQVLTRAIMELASNHPRVKPKLRSTLANWLQSHG